METRTMIRECPDCGWNTVDPLIPRCPLCHDRFGGSMDLRATAPTPTTESHD
jgi:hypothetical protein